MTMGRSCKEQHNYFMKHFILPCNTTPANKLCHDVNIIKKHHRFLWEDNVEALSSISWEQRLALRYYNKLFKEYCIADLTRHRENQVALRWRTKEEVVAGIGQFQCGSKNCKGQENLRSWEVNFAYKERGENKNSLVKLRLCPFHSDQLNYNSHKREVRRLKKSGDHRKNKKSPIHISISDDRSSTTSSIFAESKHLCEPCDQTLKTEDNFWNRKSGIGFEKTSREAEFESYLENLLL